MRVYPMLRRPTTTTPKPVLPAAVARVVRDALARRPHGATVVVFADDEVRVEDRAELVRTYRRFGVRELSTRLRTAAVPPGRVLGLVDLEIGARVVLFERDTLLAEADEDEVQPCAVFATREVSR